MNHHVIFEAWRPCHWLCAGAPRDCITVPEIYAMMIVDSFIGRVMKP